MSHLLAHLLYLLPQQLNWYTIDTIKLLRLPPTEFPRSPAPFASLKATDRSNIISDILLEYYLTQEMLSVTCKDSNDFFCFLLNDPFFQKFLLLMC